VSAVAHIIEHMIETLAQASEAGEVEDLTASDLLALARDRKAAEDQAAAELLEVAARWADLHPPESIHHAAAFTVPGCDHEEPVAGPGCPLVAEFCIAELGAVLGEEARRPRPRAAPPSPQVVGAGPRRSGAGLAGTDRRGGHHPHLPDLDG
jgi:hypothetical protein